MTTTANTMPRHWIAVASANHVARGRAGGFMQVCHGKKVPLARIRPGDLVTCYSPTDTLGDRAPCQSFTALGQVAPGDPYLHDMGGGFIPWRRDVLWDQTATPAPIRPLLDQLTLTRGHTNWGQPFRYGIVQITSEDFDLIARAMRAPPRESLSDKNGLRFCLKTGGKVDLSACAALPHAPDKR